MLDTRMLWFTPKFLDPNSSLVADTATDVIAPVHVPMMAVLAYRKKLPGLSSRKKAAAMGAIRQAMDAVLDME
jgi:hypothetical protein